MKKKRDKAYNYRLAFLETDNRYFILKPIKIINIGDTK